MKENQFTTLNVAELGQLGKIKKNSISATTRGGGFSRNLTLSRLTQQPTNSFFRIQQSNLHNKQTPEKSNIRLHQLLEDEQTKKEKPYEVVKVRRNLDQQKFLYEATDEIYQHTFNKSRQQMDKLKLVHKSNPLKTLNLDLEPVKQIFDDTIMYRTDQNINPQENKQDDVNIQKPNPMNFYINQQYLLDKAPQNLKLYSKMTNGYQTYKNKAWRTLYQQQLESQISQPRNIIEKKDHIRRPLFQQTYLDFKDYEGNIKRVNLSPQAIKIRTVLQRQLDFLQDKISDIKYHIQKSKEDKAKWMKCEENAQAIVLLNELCKKQEAKISQRYCKSVQKKHAEDEINNLSRTAQKMKMQSNNSSIEFPLQEKRSQSKTDKFKLSRNSFLNNKSQDEQSLGSSISMPQSIQMSFNIGFKSPIEQTGIYPNILRFKKFKLSQTVKEESKIQIPPKDKKKIDLKISPDKNYSSNLKGMLQIQKIWPQQEIGFNYIPKSMTMRNQNIESLKQKMKTISKQQHEKNSDRIQFPKSQDRSIIRAKSNLNLKSSQTLSPFQALAQNSLNTPSFRQLGRNDTLKKLNSSQHNYEVSKLIHTCSQFIDSNSEEGQQSNIQTITNQHDANILGEEFNHQQINQTAELLQNISKQGNPAIIKDMFNHQMAMMRQEKFNNNQIMEDYRQTRKDPRLIAQMEKERIRKMYKVIRQRNKKQIDESLLQR